MTNDQAFIAAIAMSPEDDAPRLIFADWLEEHGERTRAEFIRVQCALARLEPIDPRYPDLHVRQLELLAEHEKEWLGEWARRLVGWEFKRGLLHSVTITCEPFVSHGNDLFTHHPVERVMFVNSEGESLPDDAVREVVAAPWMAFVRALETAGCRPDEPMWAMYGGEVGTNAWLTALAGAAHVSRLEELSLTGGTRMGRQGIDPLPWREFCRATHLRTLRRLDLSDAYGTDGRDDMVRIVSGIGRAVFAEGLRSLSLSGCYFTDEAAQQLAAARLINLEELDLSGCDLLRTDGLRALLQSRVVTRVTSLGLPYGPDLHLLASCPSLSRLRSLRLSGLANGGVSMGIGDRMEPLGRRVAPNEWEILFRSPHLQNLTRLSIGANTNIPAEAVVALLQAPWAVQLRELRLSYNAATADSFQPLLARPVTGPTVLSQLKLPSVEGVGAALSRWPGLAGITDLVFDHQSSEDTRELLQSPFLSCRLARLDLTGSCGTRGMTVQLLVNCPALKGLRWLGFGYNQPTPEKVTALMTSPHLRYLESLHMGSEQDWEPERAGTSEAALGLLARSSGFPRLRDLVVGSATPEGAINVLRERFGPRLRIWCDF